MRVKMRLLMLLVICMAGIRCATPTVPEKNYEYRYNVEVTYTRPDNAELGSWGNDSQVGLEGMLYYPAGNYPYFPYDGEWWSMNKTGANTYKFIIPKVYVQKLGETKHQLNVDDFLLKNRHLTYAENISVQGAYDLEARTMQYGTALLFRMAKD